MTSWRGLANWMVTGAVGIATLLCAPWPAAAWSDPSHEIICDIAFHELTPGVKAEVQRLINLDDEFDSFARSCVWPDHPRRRATEHFVNYPRTTREVQRRADPCPLADKSASRPQTRKPGFPP
jgi:hypothetical protein